MTRYIEKLQCICLVLLVLLIGSSHTLMNMIAVGDSTPRVRFTPSLIVADSVGEEFTIACITENVYGLEGIEIEINWNVTWLEYVNHTMTIPVEDFSTPQSPSNYPGIIHAPALVVRNNVNVTSGTPGVTTSIHESGSEMTPSLSIALTRTIFCPVSAKETFSVAESVVSL